MATERFIERKFSAGSLDIIKKANVVLADYDKQNLVLTLRQLYYQFVSKGWLPNRHANYKRLGSIINDARLAGLVDWSMMEDRTRNLQTISTWDDPAEIIEVVSEQYREDLWRPQRNRVEVHIEKDALVGVIENVCRELRVEYFACRGYVSQSAQYEAGQRYRRYNKAKQRITVLHLGDHDPSGIDMTRDNQERLSMFAGFNVNVKRIALTMTQVERYNPPPNPAKESDIRFAGYAEKYGDESWELDALEPSVISKLIRDEVTALRDDILWKEFVEQETYNRNCLKRVSARWDEVEELVKGDEPEEAEED